MEFFVEKKISEKSKKEYVALFVHSNGRDYLLSMDNVIILNLLDFKPSDLFKLKVGEKVVLK